MRLSFVAQNIPGSGILAISNSIKERKKQGVQIFDYTVGDFDPFLFPIPRLLEDEIINAYRHKLTNYPAADGNHDLREAISNYMQYQYAQTFQPTEILVAGGGRPLIYAAFRAIVDKDDNVIYPSPSWNNNYYTQLVEATPVVVNTKPENFFMPTAEDIYPYLEDASLIVLCSPQNPAGTCFSRDALIKICRMIVDENNMRSVNQKKLYLLFDQMYASLVYGNEIHYDPISVCPEVRPYTIYVDAVSKAFAATGLRVGWCAGPEPILKKMKAIIGHMGAWAPMPEQKGLALFLDNHFAVESFLSAFRGQLQERLILLYKGFMQLKNEGLPVDAIEPKAALYLSVRIELDEEDTLNYLLQEAGIGLLPFSVFGANEHPHWFRLSIGTCYIKEIDPMLAKLRNAIAKSVIKN